MDFKVRDKIEKFFGRFEEKSYKAGEPLIEPHKTPGGIFCLRSGSVQMYSITKKGVEITLNVYKPISIFPLGWAINDKENQYFYDAITNVSTFVAPKNKVLSFLKEEHDVTFDLLARIYKGLDGYFLMMESLLGGNAYHKVVIHLLIHTRRFGQESAKKGVYTLSITHSKLAAFSGVSRETVTREIKKLQMKKIISYKRKGFVAINLGKIEQELYNSIQVTHK